MPTTTTFNTTYTGEIAKEYILKALVGGETLSINGIKIKEDVKYKWKPRKLSSGNLLASGGTGAYAFNPTGTLTISEVELEPKKFKVNLQIPYNEFYDLVDSVDMAAGTNKEDVPAEFAKGMNELVPNQVGKELEMGLWTGNTAIGLTGMFTQLQSCSAVSASTTVALSAANIVAKLNIMKDVLPSAVKKKGNKALVYIVSYAAADFYRQSQAALASQTSQGEQSLNIAGVDIIPVGGMPTNKMVLLSRDNIAVATDLTSDYNEVKIIDMRESNGDDTVRYILKGKIDAKVIECSEAVYYNGAA